MVVNDVKCWWFSKFQITQSFYFEKFSVNAYSYHSQGYLVLCETSMKDILGSYLKKKTHQNLTKNECSIPKSIQIYTYTPCQSLLERVKT